MCAKSLQLCQTLCDPMKYSSSGSSVHGIVQAGILKWVAMPSPQGLKNMYYNYQPIKKKTETKEYLISSWVTQLVSRGAGTQIPPGTSTCS